MASGAFVGAQSDIKDTSVCVSGSLKNYFFKEMEEACHEDDDSMIYQEATWKSKDRKMKSPELESDL